MPELPEVETIARGVHERVRGDRIVECWFSSYPQPFKTPPSKQASGLANRTILAVHRAGKHIVFELGLSDALATHAGAKPAPDTRNAELSRTRANPPDAQWIVHLGMTGRLLVTARDREFAQHTHARLTLATGREVHFVDPRRFGRLEFRNLARDTAFQGPGAEPLDVGAKQFAALFRGRHLPIKAALLNQSLLAGVGNIYADESLFRAGIRPRRRTDRVTVAEYERLRLALRQVLRHAIQLGGSSVSDYVDANGARGFYQLEHCIYQCTGEPCRRCQMPIQRILVAGRGTHFCPKCQR
jgi:formamidopyrimidine-DNA glycosylase